MPLNWNSGAFVTYPDKMLELPKGTGDTGQSEYNVAELESEFIFLPFCRWIAANP